MSFKNMVEINKTGVFLGITTLLLMLRNIFFMSDVLSVYPGYPFRMNGNFMRCTNSYFSAKGRKPLHRMLFFNTLRCMIPEIIKSFVYKGKIVIWEFNFVLCCAVTYTIFYHYLPMSVFRRFRYVYAWL